MKDHFRHSALYQCRVYHERLEPRRHRFGYPAFMFWLDLDEVKQVEDTRWFGLRKGSVFRFMERDHITDGLSLKDSIVRYVGGHDSMAANRIHHVRVLTFCRFLGYVFNPVSFFYAYGRQEQIVCAIAEVGNTFNEKKRYYIPVQKDGNLRVRTPKHFYVSPFSPVSHDFDFRPGLPGEQLSLRVDTLSGPACEVRGIVRGRRIPLTDAALRSLTLRNPLGTFGVIAGIHWEALRLWLKRVPWFAKADHPELQTHVHTSPPKANATHHHEHHVL